MASNSGIEPRQGDSSRFVYELLVMKHDVIPWNIEECKDLPELVLRMQHQLLVEHRHALARPGLHAQKVHALHRRVPLLQTAPEVLQIESGDCDGSRDDRMDDRSTVADHEEELGIWKHLGQLQSVLQCERILVAEALGRFSVLCNHLKITLHVYLTTVLYSTLQGNLLKAQPRSPFFIQTHPHAVSCTLNLNAQQSKLLS